MDQRLRLLVVVDRLLKGESEAWGQLLSLLNLKEVEALRRFADQVLFQVDSRIATAVSFDFEDCSALDTG